MSVGKVFGHERVVHALHHAIQKDQLHHTLLFSGPEGIGKRLVALQLAATHMCTSETSPSPFGGCGSCHHCKLISAGNMPDLLSISCADKTAASTEAVRELLFSLRLRPFSGAFRFLLFDDAHLLQGQAANALLKSLEEPRAGTFFILITGKPHLMLRTIHSRAQRWGFHRLSDDELLAVLQANEKEIDEESVSLANGSFESYQLLMGQGERLPELKRALTSIADGDRAVALELGAQIAKEKDELRDQLTCLHLIGRYFLHQSGDVRWATFIHELGEMDYYLLKRNFAPSYLLQALFSHLASPQPEQLLVERQRTLDHFVA